MDGDCVIERVPQEEWEALIRRYLLVDPDNRLVADSLEADWNAKLRMLAEAQELCQRHHFAVTE